jgi:hypothetical protein
MKKYLFTGLLSLATAIHAEEQSAPKMRYEATILAILSFGVENNKQVFNHPALIELAKSHKNPNKIKRLFMTYFNDKDTNSDVMEKDTTQKEVIRIFLKSIGKSADDENLRFQIEAAPNSMIEEGLKSALEDAKLSSEDLNRLAELAKELSQRISAVNPENPSSSN